MPEECSRVPVRLWPILVPFRFTALDMDEEEEEETMCSTDPSRFVKDPDFGYQEFSRQEEDHFQVLRVQVRTVPPC